MDIRNIARWTVTLIAVLAFHYARAELPEDVYRVKFDRTETMPDHLAYLALMQNLVLSSHNEGNDAAVDRVQEHISVERERAQLFLDFVMNSYDDLTSTNRAVTNRMLCKGSKPKYALNEAYAVLDVLDDIKETNLRKHYKMVLVNFDAKTAQELDVWLDAIKSDATHHKYDHERIFEHAHESVEAVIKTACGLLTAYQPT